MNKFKEMLIEDTSSINDALIKLNANKIQALIVMSKDKVVGTITDGDIRRALIKKFSTQESIKVAMNSEFLFLEPNHNIKNIQDYLYEKDIKFIPIIENGEIIDVVYKDQLSDYGDKENVVFILAGGFGTRLKPLTDNCPKPMLNIGNYPLLELTIKNFKKYGFKNFLISTHFLPEIIKDYFGSGDDLSINIKYVHEDEPLGTAGALGLIGNELSELPYVVINGDILTNINFDKMLEFHNENFATITVGAKNYEYQIPYGVIEADRNNVTKITEKPIYEFGINSGVYIISPEVIKNQKINVKKDMPELIKEELLLNKKVLTYKIYDYWRDIGKISDLELANKEIKYIKF